MLHSKQGVAWKGSLECELPHLQPQKAWSFYYHVPFEQTFTTTILGFQPFNDQTEIIWEDASDKDLPVLTVKDVDDPDSRGRVFYQSKRAEFKDKILTDGIVWPKIFDHPILVQESYKRQRNYLLDSTFQREYDLIENEAGRQGADWDLMDYSYDFNVWLIKFIYDNAGATYYKFDVKAGTLVYLFEERSAASNYRFSKTHAVEIQIQDDMTQVCYLTLPRWEDALDQGIPRKPLPMVLHVHGGPMFRNWWEYDPDAQFFANRGYAYLTCNYRGSLGYGSNFFASSAGEWAGKMHDDLLWAVGWAVEHKIAIRNKVAIHGFSYGGYAALVGLSFTPEKFACGIAISGMSNLATLLASIPPYWRPLLWEMSIRTMGGDPTTTEGKQILLDKSPLTRAKDISKPLLIGMGVNDPRVNLNESEQIVEALKANNVPLTYVVFPDEGHGFFKPENRLAFQSIQEEFLHECLGENRVEPMTDESLSRSSATIKFNNLITFAQKD